MLKKYGIFLLFFSFSILFAIPLAQLQIPFFTIKETQSYDYFIQGVNLFHQYSYKTAQQFFLKSLNVKPDFYFARRFLAESYLLDGDLESSLEEYEILRNQFPNDEFIQYKLKQIENLFFMNRKNQPLYDNRYVFWKEIGLKELKLKQFIPIDITRDDKYIYCLSFEPKAIYIFDLEGNVQNIITGSIINSIKKPSKILVTSDRFFISDFEKDEVYVFNKEKLNLLTTIKNIPYPTDLIHIENTLYIWSNREKRFYRYNENLQFIGNLEIRSANQENPIKLNLENPSFFYINENFYMFNNHKLYQIDISGYVLKELDLPSNSIKTLFLNNDIYAYATNDTIYYKKSQDWIKLREVTTIKEKQSKIEAKKFQQIQKFYIDNEFIYVLDLSGKIYFFVNEQQLFENIHVQILNIESNQYPDIAINLRISDNNNNPIINLEHQHFEIYENDKKIPLINATNIKKYENRKNILILKDKNFLIDKNFYKLFKQKMNQFFDQLKINDTVFFAITGDHINVINQSKYKLELLELMTENAFNDNESDIAQNLIQGINHLTSLKGKKAIILLTNNNKNWEEPEKIQKIQYLSLIHSVPIYVISFENNLSLREIAEKTKGKYYYFFENYHYSEIYKDLHQKPNYNYLITYKALTPYEYKLKDKYINVRIMIKYFQYGGISESGYIIP